MITFNLSAPDRTLFSDTARDLALACTPDRDKKKKNATTQIRRFYDEVVFWHDRVLKESDPELGSVQIFVSVRSWKGEGEISPPCFMT